MLHKSPVDMFVPMYECETLDDYNHNVTTYKYRLHLDKMIIFFYWQQKIESKQASKVHFYLFFIYSLYLVFFFRKYSDKDK